MEDDERPEGRGRVDAEQATARNRDPAATAGIGIQSAGDRTPAGEWATAPGGRLRAGGVRGGAAGSDAEGALDGRRPGMRARGGVEPSQRGSLVGVWQGDGGRSGRCDRAHPIREQTNRPAGSEPAAAAGGRRAGQGRDSGHLTGANAAGRGSGAAAATGATAVARRRAARETAGATVVESPTACATTEWHRRRRATWNATRHTPRPDSPLCASATTRWGANRGSCAGCCERRWHGWA